jgi:hypothetical protein
MGNLINKPLCATEYGNVGFGDCFLEPAKFAGAIQVPKDFEIAEGDLGTLQTFFLTKTHAAIGTRIFPYHSFTAVTDSSEDVQITTTDYGAKYITREGFYDFAFRYFTGGVQLHQEISKNSGSGKYFLFYDDNDTLYGYTSGGKLKGIPVDIFYVNPWKLPTGADAAGYFLRFIINPRYMNKGNLGFVKVTDFNMFDIQGLQDLDIQLVSLVGNVAKVRLFTKISDVDMHEAYATNFAQVTAWRAENQDGTAITITTAANDTVNGGWTITFNGGQFYAADKVLLRTAVASILKAAPISVTGFEGKDALTIEGPVS